MDNPQIYINSKEIVEQVHLRYEPLAVLNVERSATWLVIENKIVTCCDKNLRPPRDEEKSPHILTSLRDIRRIDRFHHMYWIHSDLKIPIIDWTSRIPI